MKSLKFTSSIIPQPGGSFPDEHYAKAYFSCSGSQLIARISDLDFQYSPVGPDERMSLSISNWVSTKVMHIGLIAIQREMEAILGPSDPLIRAFQDDTEP